MYTRHAKRSHTHVKDAVVQVEFGGLWRQQNNPACTKSVRGLTMLKLRDTIKKKKKNNNNNQFREPVWPSGKALGW